MTEEAPEVLRVSHATDATLAGERAAVRAATLGFSATVAEELKLVARELATNLLRHAGGGTVTLAAIQAEGSAGLEIRTEDHGPGIRDVDWALTDGNSTAGSLGYGLGTADRLTDELAVTSPVTRTGGTRVVGRRWLAPAADPALHCPLVVGAATRPHPGLKVNGDAFVVRTLGREILVAVFDGLGHGQWAHRASRTARLYVERHAERPLDDQLRGVARQCRPTRGVVATLVRIDPDAGRLRYAGIGNIEARLRRGGQTRRLVVRRGILGGRAPGPKLVEEPWTADSLLVLHSDGLVSHWRFDDLPDLWARPPQEIAGTLLRRLARDTDDAVVVVVREEAP